MISFTAEIDYSWQNRELMWHTFADVLMFVLPLVNVRRLRAMLLRALRPAAQRPNAR